MIGILFISIEFIVAAACVALALSHVRRVEGAVSSDLRKAAAALRKAPVGERVRELSRGAPRWSFEAGLGAQLAAAKSDEDRVAVMNEALADVELSLSERARWPLSALKIALWATMLVSITAYLVELGYDAAPAFTPILVILAMGGASALACLAAGRRADRSAREIREGADAIVTALFGRLPEAQSAPRSPSKRRRRAPR